MLKKYSTILPIFVIVLTTLAVAGASTAIYMRFQKYSPVKIPTTADVRGTATAKNTSTIPYPPKSVELSKYTTENNMVISLESKETSSDVQTFYKNVLISRKWELVTESQNNESIINEYKKNNEKIAITASPTKDQENQGNTIVTIEKTTL